MFTFLSHLIRNNSYIIPKTPRTILKNGPVSHYISINTLQMLTQLFKLLTQLHICCICIIDVGTLTYALEFSFIPSFSRYPCIMLQIMLAWTKKSEVGMYYCVRCDHKSSSFQKQATKMCGYVDLVVFFP